jgi:hypothetical protein
MHHLGAAGSVGLVGSAGVIVDVSAGAEAAGAAGAGVAVASGAGVAAGAAGGVTTTGAGITTTGAASSFLLQAVRAAAAIKAAIRTDLFMRFLFLKRR